MPLQCDPTVIYALEQVGKYNGSLTGKDLHYDSPYNTYEHGGLPQGHRHPAKSLFARRFPRADDYLYFVANTQGGNFSARRLRNTTGT